MIEVRIVSTGGQGGVALANLLANAAVIMGYQAQTFSEYGAEIRGGRVASYVRVSEDKITVHSRVYEPDYVIILDTKYVKDPAVVDGLKEGGGVLINTPDPPESFSSLGNFKVVTIDAGRIAREQGVVLPSGAPVINTAVSGAVVGLIPFVDINALAEAIREGKLPATEKNVKASQEAYSTVKLQEAGGTVAREVEETGTETGVKTQRYPVFHPEKMPRCNRCQICYIFCPDLAITFEMNPFSLAINRDLCKACGICIHECPRHAISWRGKDE